MKKIQTKRGFFPFPLISGTAISHEHFAFLVLLVFLKCGLLSAQTTYYIASEGDDTADGLTPATAWATINKLNNVNFKPGDSILFKSGDIFNGQLKLDENDGGDPTRIISVSSFGTGSATIAAGNGIGIWIENGEGIAITRLHIQGSGMETNSRSGILLRNTLEGNYKLSNIILSKLEISGFGVDGITISGLSGNSGFDKVLIDQVKVYQCLDAGIKATGTFSQVKQGYSHSNITVRNTEVFDIPGYDSEVHSGSGIVISDVQNSVIEHSTTYNCGYNNTQCGGPVGIWYYDSDQVTIQYCESYNISSGTGCDGGGFDLDGGVTNGIMQYNYSHDNDGSGFLIGQFIDSRRMNNITVRYNISENDGRTNGGGIYLFNLNPDFPPENISIYHNTVYTGNMPDNPEHAAAGVLDHLSTGSGVYFANNIFYTMGNTPFISVPKNFPVNLVNNLYYSQGQSLWKYHGTTYNTLEAFRTTGNELIDGLPAGLYTDPELNNPGKGGTVGFGNDLQSLDAYQLSHRSPALNTAIPIPDNNSETDFFGNPVLLGPLSDIGAFELDDKTPPVIYLNGDNPFVLEAGENFEDPGAYTDDGSEVILDTSPLLEEVGTYEVIYSATDLYGNTAEEIRTIDVIDTRAPEIACDEMFLELGPDGQAVADDAFLRAHITDPSAFDLEFETAVFTCESKGSQTIMVKATDIHGNSSSCMANIQVVDLKAPRLITESKSLPLLLYVAEKEKTEVPDLRPLIVAEDNCALSEDLIITQSPPAGSMLREGEYDLEITISDSSGNTITAFFPLTILEGIPDDGPLFIYPNPAKNRIKFNKEVVRTTIFDLKGTRILESYDPSIDLSFLQEGIYLLEVITPEGTFFRKVAKQ
ncbi:immunoglobulin-like domain-containing protein [Robertkochia flava]|uniref:immunoglobulin-like domain-containing protein n=1 Tax=Robertkochia flava TaxID=3447986 RepID=UPI001CCE678F|nr:immunoglobulin-like domain-containing protein [Robertkochia marina]